MKNKNKKTSTKKPNKILIVLKWIGLALVSLIILGFIYEKIAEYVDRKTIVPPGQMFEVNGHKLHIYCTGENVDNSPTVILEAGAGNFYTTWKKVQPEISKQTKVCSYDRAGLGFSESSDRKNAMDAAAELETLLKNANIPAPYIVVGHSWGGFVGRIFAHNNLQNIKGVVFVDSSHENQEKTPLTFGEKIMGYAMVGAVKFLSNTGVIRLLYTIKPNLMEWVEPAPYDNLVTRAVWANPKHHNAAIKESMDKDSWKGLESARNFDSIPIVVLSAEESVNTLPEWITWQKDLAGLSTKSTQITVKDSSHYIQIDQPQTVIDQINNLLK